VGLRQHGVEGKGDEGGPILLWREDEPGFRERWIARFVSWKVYREGGLPRSAASQVVTSSRQGFDVELNPMRPGNLPPNSRPGL
jgi:hypothetical protein